MSLELEDFFEEELPDKKSSEEDIQSYYETKLSKMEEYYKQLLEQVAKESFDKGYQQAQEETQKLCDEKIEGIVKECEAKKEQEIASIKEECTLLDKRVQESVEKYKERLIYLVSESLKEILEFLYIAPNNIEYLKKIIQEIQEEFKEHMPLRIVAGKRLYEELKDYFSSIELKVSKELGDGDFVIEFFDFEIENRFKEKVDALLDEIQREAKNIT